MHQKTAGLAKAKSLKANNKQKALNFIEGVWHSANSSYSNYSNIFGGKYNNLSSAISTLYIPYGLSPTFDLYPQYLIALSNASSTLLSALQVQHRHIEGKGLESAEIDGQIFESKKVEQKKVNKDMTLREFITYLAMQEAYFSSHTFHVNYNASYKISEINTLQFERVRRGQPNSKNEIEKNYIVGFYDPYIYNVSKTNYLEEYYNFNPRIEALQSQILSSKNKNIALAIKDFKGQIYYSYEKRPGSFWYAKPFYDSVSIDIETEEPLKISKLTDTREGFKPTTIITEFGNAMLDEESALQLQNEYREFVEPNGSRLMLRTAPDKDNAPNIQTFDATRDMAKVYEYTEESIKQNIRNAFGFSEVLYGNATTGKLGDLQEFDNAVKLANIITHKARKRIEKTLNTVLKYSSDLELQRIAENEGFKIKEFSLEEGSEVQNEGTMAQTSEINSQEKEAQAKLRGSVGGVQGILQIQQSFAKGLTNELSAINILKEIYGFSEETAQKLLGNPKKIG